MSAPSQTMDPVAARQVFQNAVAMLQGSDFANAEQAARKALKKAPNDPNMLRVLGVALSKQRKLDEAERHLTHVVRLVPDFAPAFEDLAETQLLQGKVDAAIASLRNALKHNPSSKGTQIRLGELLAMLGRGEEADDIFQKAFEDDPDRSALVEAMDLGRRGDSKKAEAIYRDILRRTPDHVDALRLMGVLCTKDENYSDAEAYFRRVVDLAPDFWTAWINLGAALNEQQKFDKAEEAFRTALSLRPNNVHSLEKLGANCMNDGRMEDAVDWLNKAVALDPEHFPSLLVLGHALKTIGKTDEAIEAYHRCAASKPDFGEVYWSLANLKTYRFSPEEIADMEQQLSTLPSDPEGEASEISLRFAMGKSCEDRKEYRQAFEHYAAGNMKKRLLVNYDPIELETQVDRLIDVFTKDFFAGREGQGCPDGAPIFIVGLPRSGSTLLEQILASHSNVEGTAELHYLLRLATETGMNRVDGIKYPQSMLELKPYQLEGLGQEYLELTEPHRSGSAYFTDKLPNNFLGVGFAHAILPNAKIIDARRHPLDSCLGSFKQLFAKGQVFTYDPYDLAHYYSQYVRIMQHWDDVLPGKVLRVNYEEVVADLETQARRIAAHCGLEWQDTMLRFHETKRAVKTASSEQVRTPLYSGSVHLWRNYEDDLGEFIDYLEPILMQLPEADRPKVLQASGADLPSGQA